MGTWGTGINSNDTSSDIYADFFELYNEGISVKDISEKLIGKNKETIDNPDDANNFWFTLALCQWECKELENQLLEKVKNIIESKNDLIIWKELDASDSDINKREKELQKFLIKLQIERKAPKKVKPKKLINSMFTKGDCLIYKMENDNWGGAFVLTDEQNTEVGGNFIAITSINQTEKPIIEDFKKSEVHIQRRKDISFVNGKLEEKWKDVPQIAIFMAVLFKKEKIDIEVIGNLKLYKQYKKENSFMGLGWNQLLKILPGKEEYEKLNGNPKTKIKLSKWTKWHWL